MKQVMQRNTIYIKHVPRDKLLYRLWENAKKSNHFYYCEELAPELTEQQVRTDINYMMEHGNDIKVTTYYGRLLFIDISDDYIDPFPCDLYNGFGYTQHAVNMVKLEELRKIVINYHLEK